MFKEVCRQYFDSIKILLLDLEMWNSSIISQIYQFIKSCFGNAYELLQ